MAICSGMRLSGQHLDLLRLKVFPVEEGQIVEIDSVEELTALDKNALTEFGGAIR